MCRTMIFYFAALVDPAMPSCAPSPERDGTDLILELGTLNVEPGTARLAHQFGSQHTAAISLNSRRNFVQDAPPSSLR
jgi:hypothetical protein